MLRIDLTLDVLKILARDPETKCHISQYYFQKHLPDEIKIICARDEDDRVRGNISGYPNLPEEAIRLLARDANEHVRSYIAQRDDIPTDVIKQLRADQSRFVQDAIHRYHP